MEYIQTKDDKKGKEQSWEAEIVGLDVPGHVNFGFGATEEEAVQDLRVRVQEYADSLVRATGLHVAKLSA